ncbi:MAG: hypothetical protein ABR499_12545 [Gemmatimonadaceae bacterium]
MTRDVPFEVESTVETAGQAYVLARLLEPGTTFDVPPGATLGGCPLDEFLNIPIASGAPGQRGELFAFCLHTPTDRPNFVEGERVFLHLPGSVT